MTVINAVSASVRNRRRPAGDALGPKKRSAHGAGAGDGDAAGLDQLTCRQEMYLIEQRLRKVPYKVIAAHLHKTDLACRLHYHQLGNRNSEEERTLSVSSSSVASQSSGATHPPSTSTTWSASSPGSTSDSLGRARSASIETTSTIASPPPPHITILPKPVPSPNRRWNSLRLETTNLSAYQQHATSTINEVRLRQAYDSVYPRFWSLVAADYGSNVAPAALQKAWCDMNSTVTGSDPLPTPCVSPHSDTVEPSVLGHPSGEPKERDCPSRFHAINEVPTAYAGAATAEKSSFAIASLLTEEKDVRNLTRRGS